MLEFKEVALSEVRNFIETFHYSKSVNGCKVSHCFAAYENGKLIGASLYGQLSTTAWKKYATTESAVIELRRLVTINKSKNLLSKFLSWQIRYLKKNSNYEMIISYADPYYGHVGYIYQATNWQYLGLTNSDILLKTPEGKIYHSRAMRTSYKGKLKPFAARLNLLYHEGKLEKVNVPGKHIYKYALKVKNISNPTCYPKAIIDK